MTIPPSTMLASQFANSLAHILDRAARSATVVAAFSGGLDSTVLLHLLARRPPAGSRIIAAHLNHSLRGADSDADQSFCRAVAESLALPFATRTEDVAEAARAGRMGLEEAGRNIRYRFCRELAGEAGLVLTAHHAGDQAETILMNLRRGAHRRGLAGMRGVSRLALPDGGAVMVGRPLLAFTREEIHAYALKHGIAWREDATNADPRFLRNRIRHRVLPGLEALMPGFGARLLARAAEAAEAEDAATARGRDLADELSRREGAGIFFRLDGAAMGTAADGEELAYALRHVFERETARRLPNGAALAGLLRLARSGAAGTALTLPGGLLARREAEGIYFAFPGRKVRVAEADAAQDAAPDAAADGTDEEEKLEFVLPAPPFAVHAGGLFVTAEWRACPASIPPEDAADPDAQWLDPARIVWPLRLRAPYPGERLRPLGSPGRRKIQDILVDGRVPRRLRSVPRVIADAGGALWLWPLRLAERARVDGPLARALRMSVRAVEPPEAAQVKK